MNRFAKKLWGPTGQINDYAKKEWGGLVRAYYKPRYSKLFDEAWTCLSEGGTWDPAAYCEAVFDHELAWQTDSTAFPVAPSADAVATALAMRAKYSPTV